MKKIPLVSRRGEVLDYALVDDEDYERLAENRWFLQRPGKGKTAYALRRDGSYRKGTQAHIYMHRVVLGLPVHGKDIVADHVDGNGLNCQKGNLRKCTIMQNVHNTGMRKSNRTGFVGVAFDRRIQKWVANIITNRKRAYLGSFNNKDDAADAYNNAAIESRGEFYHA